MFDEEAYYWERRYAMGGNSGNGSKGKEIIDKVNAITKYCVDVNTITEIGCGDFKLGSLVTSNFKDAKYLGYDLSKTIIERNKKEYQTSKIRFSLMDYNLTCKVDLVLCVDVLFHIYNQKDVDALVELLNKISKKYIVLTLICGGPSLDLPGHVKVWEIDLNKLGKIIYSREFISNGLIKGFYIFEKRKF